MKVLIQRVKQAHVEIAAETVGRIERGLLLLVGIEKHDTAQAVERMAEKVLAYRVFADSADKMNLNVRDIAGGLLVVSQFTLAADTGKGLRPSFSSAAPPDLALPLFDTFVRNLRERYPIVETGVFAADMQVHLINDGPVTFLLES